MTPVSFVKTTESYEVSLGTISGQTSYDFGILRQEYAGPNYRIGPDCGPCIAAIPGSHQCLLNKGVHVFEACN